MGRARLQDLAAELPLEVFVAFEHEDVGVLTRTVVMALAGVDRLPATESR
jgi:hypothetical protein